MAWAGVVDSAESISNVAFYNNDGEKIGSFHDQQKNYLIQGSSDELGNILLTSFETSGGGADLNTKVVNVDPLSLGLLKERLSLDRVRLGSKFLLYLYQNQHHI